MRQLQSESFADFFIRFQEWAVKTGYNEEPLMHQLRKSVHQWMDITISAQRPRPTTYDEWVEGYSALDAGVCERNLIHGVLGDDTGILPFGNTWQANAPAPVSYQDPVTGEILVVDWGPQSMDDQKDMVIDWGPPMDELQEPVVDGYEEGEEEPFGIEEDVLIDKGSHQGGYNALSPYMIFSLLL